MSTICFDSTELGNVAAAAIDTIAPYGVHGHDKILRQICACLAAYSDANAKAYRDAYGARHEDARKAKGMGWSTIYRAARRAPANLDRARGTVALLTYNLDGYRTPALEKLESILAESLGGLERAA